VLRDVLIGSDLDWQGWMVLRRIASFILAFHHDSARPVTPEFIRPGSGIWGGTASF
jgi:hypothetical protein